MERTTGYRTKNRQMILSYLRQNSNRTVCVNDIYGYLKENGMEVNLTTIYRYLDKLVAEKQLVKYASDQGDKACYHYIDKNKDCLNQLHLQCKECGELFHVDPDFATIMEKEFQTKFGFKIDYSTSILHGTCNNCKKNK